MSQVGQLVKKLVADAPPSELQAIYDDLIKITGNNPSTKREILEAIEEHNVEHCVPIALDNGQMTIISQYNREGAQFVDPALELVYSVDHLTRRAIDVRQKTMETKLTKDQNDISERIKLYGASAFAGTKVATGVYPLGQDQTVILMVSEKSNQSSYWTAYWKSEYIYNHDKMQITKGTIDVLVHYFEEGNVNLRTHHEILDETVENPSQLVDKIRDIENSVTNKLGASFRDLNDTQFKTLRRRLPINKSRINWGQAIGNYRLGKDAAEGQNLK